MRPSNRLRSTILTSEHDIEHMRYCLIPIFLILFASITSPHVFAATSNIAELVFTTDAQTIATGAVSDSLIVQTQNSSGTAEPVDETNDVTFTSSSPTGAFLNSSGNPVTTTMNRNTSSRTFFYKDSGAGTHTLTVSIKGRTTGTTFVASQQIIIGTNTSTVETTSIATTTATTSNIIESNPVNTTGTTYISSHSGSEEVSNFASIKLGVDAGRDRVITINSPVHFLAKVEDLYTDVYSRVSSSWSFGDGTQATGREVDHIYKFPGEYNVVLNVTLGNTHSTDRFRVKVIEPSLSISKVVRGIGGYVAIKNDSGEEVNLQAFKVSSGGEYFFFAPDTIISAHTETKFPFTFISNVWNQVSLAYPEGETLTVAGDVSQPIVAVDPEYQIRRAEAERRLTASLSLPVKPISQAPALEDAVTPNLDQTASLIAAMKQSKSERGLLSTFTGFFGRIFK